MVDNVLRAASMTAQALLQAPVLLHGGEGRDMTLVISSLTQVILLPEGLPMTTSFLIRILAFNIRRAEIHRNLIFFPTGADYKA